MNETSNESKNNQTANDKRVGSQAVGYNFKSRRYSVGGINDKNVNIEFITIKDGSIQVIENNKICLDEHETHWPFKHLRRIKL